MIGVQQFGKAFRDGLKSIEKKQLYKLLVTSIVLLFYLLYLVVKGKFHQQSVYFLILTFLILGICWFIDFKAVKNKVNFENDRFNLLFVGGVALCFYMVHCAIFGIPLAQNQDDYSYLLMAKTFAEGRLTNPAHPMREFFDNLNIINYF